MPCNVCMKYINHSATPRTFPSCHISKIYEQRQRFVQRARRAHHPVTAGPSCRWLAFQPCLEPSCGLLPATSNWPAEPGRVLPSGSKVVCLWAFARCSYTAGPAATRSCSLPSFCCGIDGSPPLAPWDCGTVAAFRAPAPPESSLPATCVYAALSRAKDLAIRSLHIQTGVAHGSNIHTDHTEGFAAGVIHRLGLQTPCTARQWESKYGATLCWWQARNELLA